MRKRRYMGALLGEWIIHEVATTSCVSVTAAPKQAVGIATHAALYEGGRRQRSPVGFEVQDEIFGEESEHELVG